MPDPPDTSKCPRRRGCSLEPLVDMAELFRLGILAALIPSSVFGFALYLSWTRRRPPGGPPARRPH